ncbi:MAG: head-tail adaptor protein [Planctomycetaceae bacterium]
MTIQNRSVTRDDTGQRLSHGVTWRRSGDVWSTFWQQAETAVQPSTETTHQVTLRYTTLSAADRLKLGERVLQIINILNTDERNIELVVMCRRLRERTDNYGHSRDRPGVGQAGAKLQRMAQEGGTIRLRKCIGGRDCPQVSEGFGQDSETRSRSGRRANHGLPSVWMSKARMTTTSPVLGVWNEYEMVAWGLRPGPTLRPVFDTMQESASKAAQAGRLAEVERANNK